MLGKGRAGLGASSQKALFAEFSLQPHEINHTIFAFRVAKSVRGFTLQTHALPLAAAAARHSCRVPTFVASPAHLSP